MATRKIMVKKKISSMNDDFIKQADEFQKLNKFMENLSVEAEFLRNTAKNY